MWENYYVTELEAQGQCLESNHLFMASLSEIKEIYKNRFPTTMYSKVMNREHTFFKDRKSNLFNNQGEELTTVLYRKDGKMYWELIKEKEVRILPVNIEDYKFGYIQYNNMYVMWEKITPQTIKSVSVGEYD